MSVTVIDKSDVAMARLIAELMNSFEKAGYPRVLVKKLTDVDELRRIKPVLEDFAEVVVSEHVIDCDANPWALYDFKVEEHIKHGLFHWNPNNIELRLCGRQIYGFANRGFEKGANICQLLQGEKVLNANVLDYLLEHPHIIPEEWKCKIVPFWGTIYSFTDDVLFVRALYWTGLEWSWQNLPFWESYHDKYPAAILKPA